MLRPQSFKPITIPKAIHLNHRVADLININGEWNWALISGILWDVDAEEVKRIHLCDNSENDRLVWHYDSKGEFTVRSGYHLAMSQEESGSNGLQCGFSSGLKKMWGLRISNKIKIHIWMMIFDALPTRSNLMIRKVNVDTHCPRCFTEEESVSHIFWYCNFAQKFGNIHTYGML